MEKAKTLILASFLILQGCGEKFYEQRPFNVSKPNQIFRSSFVVEEEYDYRFALIFNWTNAGNLESKEAQEALIGKFHAKGMPLILDLKIVKDGELFSENSIQTNSSSRYEGFCYNEKTQKNEKFPSFLKSLFFPAADCNKNPNTRDIWGPSRTLQITTLPPGNYYLEIKTLAPVVEFSEMETFIEISPYSPKI